MARRKKKSWKSDEKDAEINMTPMIDCVFQLLIFFMVGTHFHTDDAMLAAHLPKDKGQRAVEHINKKEELEHVRIKLIYAGPRRTTCTVNNQGVSFDTTNDPAGRALKAHLTSLAASGGQVPVTIDAEFTIETRDVVCVLNAAISAGFKEINFSVPDILKRGGGLTH